MFWIAQTIAGLFGWDISKVQRWVIGIGIVLLAILLISVGLWVRSCVSSHRAAHALKVQQEQLAKINSANEQEKKAALQQVIQDNSDVVTTVNQRNVIADSDETQRNLDINQKVQDAAEKVAAAKAQGGDVTGPQLDCMLTGANCQ